ncbi:MAG: hypothetical protein U5L05_19265 [Rubrivivax sp.]|nr:hypothetical protein [Rubrivivax sp.]
MLRFKPDGWLEGLLRPFILVDPNGFIYYELPAPDLRFAAITVLMGIALASGRLRARLGAPAWRTLLGLWLIFYLWTFLTGNGRYFMTGLLLAGPLVVLLVGSLPFTRSMRLLLLAGLLGLQGMVVLQHFKHGMWAMAYWRDGPGLPLGETPLRNEPAVFITISSISQSILVPQFHPLSRWANISGQVDIAPGIPEHAALRELLKSPMPRYLVLHVVTGIPENGTQPQGEILEMMRDTLARHGLQRDDRPCEALGSHLLLQHMLKRGTPSLPLAYWFCPLSDGLLTGPAVAPTAQAWNDVFDAVEERCPRFFPPGRGQTGNCR